MTNFEVWRDQLTPKEVWALVEAVSIHRCDTCEEPWSCDKTWTSCKERFLRWANTPAKED